MKKQAQAKTNGALGMAIAGFGLISVPSFLLFVVFSYVIGGDALNGFTAEGRHFVSSHGVHTEVSWLTYTISWCLGAITLATFIPMVLLGAVSEFLNRRVRDIA